MEFWQSVAFLDTGQLIEVAVASEAAGYHGITLSDHVVFPEKLSSKYPYSADGSPRWDGTTDWPDPWVAIAAMAAATRRLRFTTNIFVVPSRDPLLLAKAIATAHALAGGRLSLGASAGWMREEFDLLGVDFDSRGRRLDEMVDVLRLLWSGEMVEHHGEFFDFGRVQMRPATPADKPIPILAGGHSEPALRRAARLDGWIGNAYKPDDAIHYLDRLDALRQEAGTADRDDYQVILGLIAWPSADLCEEFAGRGVTGLLSAPWQIYPELPIADAINKFADQIGLGR